MKVKSIRGGVTQDITPEVWQGMVKSGRARHYKIVSTGTAAKTPAAVQGADFAAIVKEADELHANGSYEDANELYERAKAINATKHVMRQLKEIAELLK